MVDQENAKLKVAPQQHEASNLAQLLCVQELLHSRQPALIVNNQSFTYAELIKQVRQLATLLEKNKIKRLGILASKSLEAYLGVLAAQWLGVAHVPLNPYYPELRLQKVMASAEVDGVIADSFSLPLAKNLLSAASSPITLADLPESAPQTLKPVAVQKTDLAYIIFTSGSSGEPKGVPITYANLASFIRVVKERYPLTLGDRVSQFSALAFDVSLFDMCLAFGNGAALYVVPDSTRLAPAKFIQENELSVWLSVPSIITNLAKLKMLKANNFPTLKYSLFTGEALTVAQAQQWASAAPGSQLENLYGPTEVTIDCLGQVYHAQAVANSFRDQVAIGIPFANLSAALIDENEKFLKPGAKGELVIAGAQVASGYWQDKTLTAKKFKNLIHPQLGLQRWFLTGDYCYQDSQGIFHYIARLDNQCKILGNRIELEEIEFHVRDMTGSHAVAACVVGDELIVVTDIKDIDVNLLETQLKQRLPVYMMPARFIYRDSLFLNANGKIDRKAMTQWVRNYIDSSRGGLAC
jgi:D-alanine--poly(phosphoribitol) ligase subunit 1